MRVPTRKERLRLRNRNYSFHRFRADQEVESNCTCRGVRREVVSDQFHIYEYAVSQELTALSVIFQDQSTT